MILSAPYTRLYLLFRFQTDSIQWKVEVLRQNWLIRRLSQATKEDSDVWIESLPTSWEGLVNMMSQDADIRIRDQLPMSTQLYRVMQFRGRVFCLFRNPRKDHSQHQSIPCTGSDVYRFLLKRSTCPAYDDECEIFAKSVGQARDCIAYLLRLSLQDPLVHLQQLISRKEPACPLHARDLRLVAFRCSSLKLCNLHFTKEQVRALRFIATRQDPVCLTLDSCTFEPHTKSEAYEFWTKEGSFVVDSDEACRSCLKLEVASTTPTVDGLWIPLLLGGSSCYSLSIQGCLLDKECCQHLAALEHIQQLSLLFGTKTINPEDIDIIYKSIKAGKGPIKLVQKTTDIRHLSTLVEALSSQACRVKHLELGRNGTLEDVRTVLKFSRRVEVICIHALIIQSKTVSLYEEVLGLLAKNTRVHHIGLFDFHSLPEDQQNEAVSSFSEVFNTNRCLEKVEITRSGSMRRIWKLHRISERLRLNGFRKKIQKLRSVQNAKLQSAIVVSALIQTTELSHKWYLCRTFLPSL